jgi:hypothetical protein
VRALLAISLIAGTVARAEPRSWEDPIRARAEDLAIRASQRFDEVMVNRSIVEIEETSMSSPVAVAIGRVMIIGAGESVSGMLLAD